MLKLFIPLLFALLDGNAQDHTTIKDTTDVVEINHVYKENENGELAQRLVQVIWWDWKNPLLIPEKNNVGEYTGMPILRCREGLFSRSNL